MNDKIHCMMEGGSGSMAPAIPTYDANVDYIISDYMERLGTRLNILETELKYAWRALDLLSQEYIKMWERLEKLEGLLYEQQSVIAQLLDFYTSGGRCSEVGGERGAILDGRLGELEVIREILGNGTVEDGLEEGVDVTRPIHSQDPVIEEIEMDEINVPDEAFYRSLNQAYREDLVGPDSMKQASQLGMIWEEREENESHEEKSEIRQLEDEIRLEESQDVYSAMDYKDYRGNSPCVNEQDIAQLSRISSIDKVTMEKLNELDRLSTKLQQDSFNIKQLQRKLLESPRSKSNKDLSNVTDEKIVSDNACIDEEIKQVYEESNNWGYPHEHSSKSDLSNVFPNRPSSRLSVTESVTATDNEVAETLGGGLRTPTSPRRRQSDIATCSAPYTTVTGRLAYSAAVHNAETAEAAAAAASLNPFLSMNPFYTSDFNDMNSIIPVPFETIHSSTPSIFNVKSERALSPALSICSVRTRQDGYIGSNEPSKSDDSTPPPPAPQNAMEKFNEPQSNSVFLGADTAQKDLGRLSPKVPHSPKSPKSSPKRSKSHSSTINTAKSDSGLSSMSGWSSLEKSPGSPKNLKPHTLNYHPHIRSASPIVNDPINTRNFTETDVDTRGPLLVPVCNAILPGGHHLSAFTTVKSPCSLETTEGYGTFVPAPAPASDINVSPRPKPKVVKTQQTDYSYRNDAIYSVAGSNRQESYTSVYTSNSADYINQTIKYPDLVEPYENNEIQKHYNYNSSPTAHATRRKSLNRSYSTSNGTENLENHEGYKMAMQRTMFPSGNITDALSYYPTSSRYESSQFNLPDYNESHNLFNCPEGQYPVDSASTSSSIRSMETAESGYSQSPYLDQRRYQRSQPIYQNQEQIYWNQRQDIPYLELDLRNRNVPEYIVQQQQAQQQQQQHDGKFYDSGVIVSQSGYISISSNMNESTAQMQPFPQKGSKKFKRGNTLKSAMNSVSHWLPDLHFSKRHRSYSLPGNGTSTVESPSKNGVNKSMFHKKKKKIVSTVSGILQKAKRRSMSHAHSLSDPEQSENEWVLNRASSVVSEDDRSEDSYSMFSESQTDHLNLFEKVNTGKTKIRMTDSNSSQLSEPITFDTVKLSPLPGQPGESITPKTDQDTDISDHFIGDEEISGKSTGSGSSGGIFATIGDVKKNSAQSDKSEDSAGSDGKNFPPVTLGGASMEFAVSRALGKYRQRQTSSSINDEQDEISDKTEDKPEPMELPEIKESTEVKVPPLPEQKSTESTNSIENHKVNNSFNDSENCSPASSFRSQFGRFARHQQSLEIPGLRGEDDDNRSTHSWRSTSRVSSRRQSTEDSIDSEDEWYCYELKKLEELERQSALEAEMGTTLEVEENEDNFEPDEEVKEKMTFVLRELRIKTKLIEGVLEEFDYNHQVLASAKARGQEVKFEEDFLDDVVEAEEAKSDDEDDNSGDTSGPDSPRHSISEFEEAELAIADEFARCKMTGKEEEIIPADVPKIQIDIPISVSKEEVKDDGKDSGPLGSKWKLLKALKERKAEEKNNQEKVSDTTSEKEKVGMLGMMQKFYEIHVKT